MFRPSFQRRIPPTASACRGGSLMLNMNSRPLMRWTSRTPATPVPYSFQQRQRAKMFGSNARLGTSPCHISQSSVRGERSGGGGYSHAPVGSFRPSDPSSRSAAPAHTPPGSLIDSPKSPEPCMPTPTIPNRTVSLGGTRPARSDGVARDAPTAAPLSSRNSRRDQVVFMVTALSHALPRGEVGGRGRRRPHAE